MAEDGVPMWAETAGQARRLLNESVHQVDRVGGMDATKIRAMCGIGYALLALLEHAQNESS